jgi:alginate O-acetyltransferase complex protein AlgI
MQGFNSPVFLFVFLPLFVAIFHLSGKRGKIIVGICSSLIFYAWGNLVYIPLMAALILVNYLLAKRISGGASAWLWLGILADIGVLVFFKLAHDTPFPLGLSYVSFQLVSYLLDVRKKATGVEDDFLKFAFYVLLFPKIMVGPIERYRSIKDQIGNFNTTPQKVTDGIRRFVRGLAKKVLIADTLGKIVTPVFGMANPTIAPWLAWLVIVSFALQLFFDFSGYTDMALGLGRIMGLQFMENFDFPYLTKSISEFWRRWHISLSSWYRDYVFYPLERRRLKWLGQPINILIVFALTGLWHGISLNYLAWGLMHGAAIVFESSGLGRRLRSFWSPVQRLYALAVLLLSWVFFRSPNLYFATRFLRRLFGYTRGITPLSFQKMNPLPIIDPTVVMALVFAIVLCFPVGKWLSRWTARLAGEKFYLRLAFQILYDFMILLLFAASVAAVAASGYAPGIYDKF